MAFSMPSRVSNSQWPSPVMWRWASQNVTSPAFCINALTSRQDARDEMFSTCTRYLDRLVKNKKAKNQRFKGKQKYSLRKKKKLLKDVINHHQPIPKDKRMFSSGSNASSSSNRYVSRCGTSVKVLLIETRAIFVVGDGSFRDALHVQPPRVLRSNFSRSSRTPHLVNTNYSVSGNYYWESLFYKQLL